MKGCGITTLSLASKKRSNFIQNLVMAKDWKKYILPVAIGAAGIWFIMKQMKGKKMGNKKVGGTDMGGATSQEPTPAEKPVSSASEGVSQYTVTTASSALNMRSSAGLTSPVIGKLEKGSTVYGRATSDSQWIEITDADGNNKGYAASMYLTKA